MLSYAAGHELTVQVEHLVAARVRARSILAVDPDVVALGARRWRIDRAPLGRPRLAQRAAASPIGAFSDTAAAQQRDAQRRQDSRKTHSRTDPTPRHTLKHACAINRQGTAERASGAANRTAVPVALQDEIGRAHV